MDGQRSSSSIIDLTQDSPLHNSSPVSADQCFSPPLYDGISLDPKATLPDAQIGPLPNRNEQVYHVANEDKLRDLENVERETWMAYGLDGDLDSDFLFKEVQRRVRPPESGSRTRAFNLERLNCLVELHRLRLDGAPPTRRMSNIGGKKKAQNHKRTPSGPQEKMRNVGSRMWALLIGINNYPDSEMLPLKGCITDVDAIRDYLQEYLFLPQSHISSLCDAAATRSGILDALYSLRDNTSITSEDNILITFSGHGSSYDADKHFKSDAGKAGSVEALCPIDRGTTDAAGNVIHDISDREINIILEEIGMKRTGNITLFFDCCYAGGVTRSSFAPSISEPIKQPLPPLEHGLEMMLDSADRDPRRISSLRASVEDWEPNLSFHVLLASCLHYQMAHEVHNLQTGRSQGLFVTALLEVLKSKESEDATYRDVIDWVGPLGSGKLQQPQTPIAIGERCGSRLWFQDIES